MKDFIIKQADNKLTGVDHASVSCIRQRVIKQFEKDYKEKHGKTLKISQECMRKHMNTLLSKPRKLRKSFLLTQSNIEYRKKWCQDVLDSGVKLSNIFFTDEKKFYLHRHIHVGQNYIRLTKECEQTIKNVSPEIENLLNSAPKYSQSFMVAGGITEHRIGKLIFITGNQDSIRKIKKRK